MNKQEYIQALRNLADFMEQREFPGTWKGTFSNGYPSVSLVLYTKDKQTFGEATKAIGTCRKRADGGFLEVTREEPTFIVQINAYRDGVCERVVTGTKTIPAKEEEIIPAEPEHEEEIVEWKCPESFMALADTNSEVNQEEN